MGPLAIASMGMSAAGGILGAFGAAQKDDATAAMYNYKAGIAQVNQKIAKQNAAYETQRGGILAEQVGLAGGQQMGQITAAQAASGIDINTGTSTKVRESQLAGIQTHEATVSSDAARKAYGYDIEGMNYAAQAGMDIQAGKFAEEQKGFDVASSLLGGATSVADKWSKFKTVGVSGF